MHTIATSRAGASRLVRSDAAARPVLVAIPARNEAEELPDCLSSLAAQHGKPVNSAVVCLNDCTDDSAGVIRRLARDLPFPVHALEVALPPDRACAGLARRMAMERAAALAGAEGILLTTDADTRVPPDWVAANLAAIAGGADAVAGRAEIEPVGALRIPAHLHAIDASECAYAALLDEIRSLLDPDPADPWPRHDEHCGASIAVTVAAYRRAGGMPAVTLAEDRAFFSRLRQIDARIRHAPEVRVVVSARLEGRAPGGMADTMRRRMVRVDPFLDDRLEPAHAATRRALLCGRLRRIWRSGSATPRELRRMASRLALSPDDLARFFAAKGPDGTLSFGAAWDCIAAHSPALRPRLVPLADLPAETAHAMRMRDRLRRVADPADRPFAAAAE